MSLSYLLSLCALVIVEHRTMFDRWAVHTYRPLIGIQWYSTYKACSGWNRIGAIEWSQIYLRVVGKCQTLARCHLILLDRNDMVWCRESSTCWSCDVTGLMKIYVSRSTTHPRGLLWHTKAPERLQRPNLISFKCWSRRNVLYCLHTSVQQPGSFQMVTMNVLKAHLYNCS